MAFSLASPRTPAAAIRLLADAPRGDVEVLAGGTDLLLDLDAGRVAPSRLIALGRLPWRTLRRSGGDLVIGATLPLADLERDPRLPRDLPGLFRAVRAVGSVALRHRATIGGNIARASPASDLLPVLLALDARVRLLGPSGARELPLPALLRGPRETSLTPGELISHVVVPVRRPSAYLWQRVRPSNDISQVGIAVARRERAPYWAVALGGVWPVPVRLPSVETILDAPVPGDAQVERAAQEAALRAPFVTDKRATETYRRRLVAILLRRAVHAVAGAPQGRSR